MTTKTLFALMKRFPPLLALAVLTACGGGCGGGGMEPVEAKLTIDVQGLNQPTTTPTPVVQKKVLITQYGDSTTYGWYIATDGSVKRVDPSPVKQLENLLQLKYGDRVTVKDNANNGGSLRDLLQGTNGVLKPLSEAVKDDLGQIATVKYGLNDMMNYSTAEFKGYLVSTIQILQAAGKRVVLEEPSPADDGRAQPFAVVVGQVATEFSLPLVKNYTLPAWSTPTSDGIHPTAAQYFATVPAQVPVLSPVIESLF